MALSGETLAADMTCPGSARAAIEAVMVEEDSALQDDWSPAVLSKSSSEA